MIQSTIEILVGGDLILLGLVLRQVAFGDRYRKVLNSFYADWHRPETLARSKSIRRDACLRAKRERGVPVAPICRELGLNVGNVNAWLKNGDMSKVSLENATRLAHAFRAA